jgi:tRNA A-37 threonylcarbamoyl transferase component Bud32
VARRVGRYELLRIIGRGGMATVYLARQTDLDRYVALKQLKVLAESDPRLARRFLHEARLAGSFSHPNIVTVHDFIEHEGTPYIAMEYLPRGSLRPHVGRLSLAQIGGMLVGVLSGLAHAEERGVVHRDLKPENIMISSQGWVKIADFGIAKATSSAQTETSLTTTGTTLGTPRYMAPERALGQEIGPWTDLYSIGVIVFELLVGHAPFQDADSPMEVMMRQINEPIPSLGSLVPDVGPAISDWTARLLEKDPAQRTRSAAIAGQEIEEILIDQLGPRWLRDAGLPERPGGPATPLSGTPERVAQVPAPAVGPAVAAAVTPGTVPMGDAGDELAAATVAPLTLRVGSDPPPQPRARAPRRRRVVGLVRLALVVGALMVGVAAAVTSGGGSDPPHSGENTRALNGLRRQARTHGDNLTSASTTGERSRAATSLADDYDRAAREQAGAGDPRVMTALDDAASAYREVAAAARRGDDAAYRSALAAAREREAAVDDARRAAARAADDEGGAGDSQSDDESGAGDSQSDDESGAGDSQSDDESGVGDSQSDDESGVGDSQSDDPSDDEPDRGEP